MPEKEESEKLEDRKMKAKAWKTGKEKRESLEQCENSKALQSTEIF